eukprot:scaffold1307_cov166-Ochromonas_danica.AAC.31
MMAFYILLVDVNEQAFHRHRVEYLTRQAQLLNSSTYGNSDNRNGLFHYHPLHGNNSTTYINATTLHNGQNETSILHPSHHNSMSATTSIWISLMLSLISWMTIIQILRYLRYYQVSSRLAATTRLPLGRQEQYLLAHMIRMSRDGDPMAMPQLMSRLRMMLISRDFTGEDYELLQQLDGGGSGGQRGASNELIASLPVTVLRHEDVHRSARSTSSSSRLIMDDDDDDLERQNHHHHHEEEDDDRLGRCNICLAGYEVGDRLKALPCTHRFHADCLDPWLRTNAVCPICKLSLR